MVLVRVKVAVGNRSGIVEHLAGQKGGFFVFSQGYKDASTHTIDLIHAKIEERTKRGDSGVALPQSVTRHTSKLVSLSCSDL